MAQLRSVITPFDLCTRSQDPLKSYHVVSEAVARETNGGEMGHAHVDGRLSATVVKYYHVM